MSRTVRLLVALLMAWVMPLTAYASVVAVCTQHGLPIQEHRAQSGSGLGSVSASTAHATHAFAGPDYPVTNPQHASLHAAHHAPLHAPLHAAHHEPAHASAQDPAPGDSGPLSGGTLPCVACMAASCKLTGMVASLDAAAPVSAQEPPIASPPPLRVGHLSSALERPPRDRSRS